MENENREEYINAQLAEFTDNQKDIYELFMAKCAMLSIGVIMVGDSSVLQWDSLLNQVRVQIAFDLIEVENQLIENNLSIDEQISDIFNKKN